ncbi:MAG: TlpA disulfide reductase family protein [bacterium]|nr:TlpA disulfide reductase family protein [bacterium]
MKHLVTLILAALLLAGCEKKPAETSGSWAQFAETAGMAPDQVGQRAPDFDYVLLEGQTGRLSDHQGKLVFLNFWATWCLPCKKEMPDIEELSSLMKGKPFVILAVSSGEGAEKVSLYHKKFPYSFPFAMDADGAISAKYEVNLLPSTFLISPEGEIIGKAIGPRHWSADEFINQLEGLLPKER